MAPVEVASVALTGMAGGEVVVAAGLLIASTLLTVLLAGPILGLLGAHSVVSQLGLLVHAGPGRGPAPDRWLRDAHPRSVRRA